MAKKTKNLVVSVVAYDQLCMFEFGIALEAFGLPRPDFETWYQCNIIAATPASIRALGSIVIEAEYNLAALAASDLIIIPGWSGADVPLPEAFKQALLTAHKNGARIASICSGVFALADAHLLNEKTVTTHWKYAHLLQNKYPDLNIDPNVLYIDEGDILTSAGSAAGLDLCLHIIRQDFGHKIANQVARQMVLPAHREGGQAQYIASPLTPQNQTGDIAKTLDHMRANLVDGWTVKQMAQNAIMSERSFLRKFKQVTGETPLVWLTKQRLYKVKELLEASELNVSQIAAATGFMTPETLRHHFRRLLGISPLKYRAQFHR